MSLRFSLLSSCGTVFVFLVLNAEGFEVITVFQLQCLCVAGFYVFRMLQAELVSLFCFVAC